MTVLKTINNGLSWIPYLIGEQQAYEGKSLNFQRTYNYNRAIIIILPKTLSTVK